MEHTPGPWKVGVHATGPSGQGRMEVTTHDGFWLADVLNSKEQEANARLIAAAPEMLEALTFWERWSRYHPHKESHSENCDFCKGNRLARAAIKAAKGGA